MKKVILLLVLLLSIILNTSCSEENEQQKDQLQNQNTEQSIKIGEWQVWSTNTFQERKIDTKLEDGKLFIWNNVIISEWQSEYIDFNFPVIKWWKIYKNSNVKKYGFIISSKDTSIEYIKKYYQTEFKKLWWIEEKSDNLDILLFIKNKTNNLLEELIIKITPEIPKILKDNYNFEWNYIEFNLGNKVIEPEELIEE